jgi:hypothetical protein
MHDDSPITCERRRALVGHLEDEVNRSRGRKRWRGQAEIPLVGRVIKSKLPFVVALLGVEHPEETQRVSIRIIAPQCVQMKLFSGMNREFIGRLKPHDRGMVAFGVWPNGPADTSREVVLILFPLAPDGGLVACIALAVDGGQNRVFGIRPKRPRLRTGPNRGHGGTKGARHGYKPG